MTTRSYSSVPRGEPAVILSLRGLIDLWTTTQHRLRSEVSSEPLESGSPLTDHIVRLPNKLRLQGVVSDVVDPGVSPSPGTAATRAAVGETLFFAAQLGQSRGMPPPLEERASKAWERIQQMQREREVFEVLTHLGLYRNMTIEGVQHITSSETGLSLVVNLDLVEVLFVPKQTPAAVLQNQNRRDLADVEADIARNRRAASEAAGDAAAAAVNAAAIAQFEAEAFVVTQLDQANPGRRQSRNVNVVEQRRAFNAMQNSGLAQVNPNSVLDRRLNRTDRERVPVKTNTGSVLDRRLNREE